MSGSCHKNEDVWPDRPGGPIRLPLLQQPESLPWIFVAEYYVHEMRWNKATSSIAKRYLVKDFENYCRQLQNILWIKIKFRNYVDSLTRCGPDD